MTKQNTTKKHAKEHQFLWNSYYDDKGIFQSPQDIWDEYK